MELFSEILKPLRCSLPHPIVLQLMRMVVQILPLVKHLVSRHQQFHNQNVCSILMFVNCESIFS